jgi:hypothetical protein
MMKQNKLITLIVLTITVICSSLPLQGQTKLYNQYKHRTDMVVMCVMDYPLTDSIKTDITLFQPKTPDHLWPMVQEFNLGLDKEEVYNRFGQEKKYSLSTRNVRKDDVKKRFGEIKSDEDYKNISILAYNYNTGTIVVFHNIETEERDNAISEFLIGTLTEPEKFPTIDNANNKK